MFSRAVPTGIKPFYLEVISYMVIDVTGRGIPFQKAFDAWFNFPYVYSKVPIRDVGVYIDESYYDSFLTIDAFVVQPPVLFHVKTYDALL